MNKLSIDVTYNETDNPRITVSDSKMGLLIADSMKFIVKMFHGVTKKQFIECLIDPENKFMHEYYDYSTLFDEDVLTISFNNNTQVLNDDNTIRCQLLADTVMSITEEFDCVFDEDQRELFPTDQAMYRIMINSGKHIYLHEVFEDKDELINKYFSGDHYKQNLLKLNQDHNDIINGKIEHGGRLFIERKELCHGKR